MDVEALIKQQIAENTVLLYMKGTPQFPQCGFSARTVEALMQLGEPFAYVNILENPDIRSTLPKMANWPTFPQLWVKGELIGGCDIVLEMTQKGELATCVKDLFAQGLLTWSINNHNFRLPNIRTKNHNICTYRISLDSFFN